jgi:uncharacterized protein YraI
MAASRNSRVRARRRGDLRRPGQDYPLVARIAPGVAVRVQGCLSDYTWCDVTFGGNRGWVYGGELGYAYQSRRVPIASTGRASRCR